MTDTQVQAPIVPVLRRRLRALAQLAGVTGIAVLLAALALWQRASTGQPDFTAALMFPSLKANDDKVATIQIETKDAAFNVVKNAEGQWVVPDRANYPADRNTILKTILGLAELNLVEQRTSRADWHDKLGVGLPKAKGTGTLVTMKDAKGEVLASVIAGSAVEGASAGGQQAIYVRRADQPQTFVARGNFAPPTVLTQWLDKRFVELARNRVKSVAMKPFKGRPFNVVRDKPEDANFRIVESIPAGRVLRTENEPNGIGNALLGLSFEDVRKQTPADLANAAQTTFVTFDGLTLNLTLIEQNGDYWLTANAVADPSVQPPPAAPGSTALKPDVAKEAKEINGLVAGWTFKVPRYKGTLLTVPLEDLLRPVGTPAGPSVTPNR
jgi:non-ribosomal peptide synthetase component F